ncbi:hypothetical protein EYF80_016960 [Liparis tanakae]|uniref:Uncharacterized protein n=1 Tax=Liparis tanakae TaxID=230148 RepID=A0A4Z2I455_9TELE|nr:hypothetical protein EYF80_016960 [Liparis tanakae]
MIFLKDFLGPGSFRAVKGPFVHVQAAERCTFCASLPMHPATVHHDCGFEARIPNNRLRNPREEELQEKAPEPARPPSYWKLRDGEKIPRSLVAPRNLLPGVCR